MKNFFKKSNDQYSKITTKIPEILFNENTHLNIETFSRLSPSFDKMLELQYARQTFQKYLRTIHQNEVFQCFLELLSLKNCTNDCRFHKDKIDIHCELFVCVMNDFNYNDTSYRGKVEGFLDEFSNGKHQDTCVYSRLYRKYLLKAYNNPSESHEISSFDEMNGVPKIIMETFLHHHDSLLPPVEYLQISLRDHLKDVLYPQYLQSPFHQIYQLQLLNSGLNTLRLSDFLYNEDCLMIITEFFDFNNLTQYLLFLLGVIRLGDSDDKCSFVDALDIYSKFLVMDSSNFLDIPFTIANDVVNSICQHEREESDLNTVIVSTSFQSAFKPIYLFLEQFWFPQFLISPIYQKHLSSLVDTIDDYHVRNRNYSDTTLQTSSLQPREVFISEDDNSDISTDNASIKSEPTISSFEKPSDIPGSSSWWPPRRLDNRLSRDHTRPMTLGSFDDLGRYQSINSSTKHPPSGKTSASSDILSTISELSNDFWNKVQSNNENNSNNAAQSPDDVARQIINDIHRMTLMNL